MKNGDAVLRKRAIRVDQHPKHPLFMLSLTADELLEIADISRVSRDSAGSLVGYQRPEVKKHVRSIVEYLDNGEVLFPNSIILALSSACSFKQVRGPKIDEGAAEAGTLEIPIPREGQAKPAWIVDGQQRALALSHTKRRDLPVPVNAFVADEVELQRDQFLRVNNTKPLPKGLISELLPEVDTVLPANLAARKAPAALCDILNRDKESPFFELIRRSSMESEQRKRAVITDTALIKMLQDSFAHANGCLFPYRSTATGETDFPSVQKLLYMYWGVVQDIFPDAWGRPPEESRLMHGAGIRAMGKLMDRVMGSINPNDSRATQHVKHELQRIRPVCRWTEGRWEEFDLEWNAVQNLPGHIRQLTEVLMRAFLNQGKSAA